MDAILVQLLEQAFSGRVIADHAGEVDLGAERTGIDAGIRCAARNSKGVALRQHQHWSLTGDLQWRAEDILVGAHVADDQQAFAGKLADEARQPIALGGSSHKDDFLTSTGASPTGAWRAPHTSIAWRLSRRALLHSRQWRSQQKEGP